MGSTIKHEKAIIKFKQSLRKSKPKKKTVKKFPEINHAKGLSYSEFLESNYWKAVRKKVLERDGHKCVACHITYCLHVHHLSYKNHGFELKYLEDLTTLCKEHHKIAHGII